MIVVCTISFHFFWCYLLLIRQVFTDNFFPSFLLFFIVCYQITLAFQWNLCMCRAQNVPTRKRNTRTPKDTFIQITWASRAVYDSKRERCMTIHQVKFIYAFILAFLRTVSSMIYIVFIRFVLFISFWMMHIMIVLTCSRTVRAHDKHLISMAHI